MSLKAIQHIPNRFLALYYRQLNDQERMLERIRRLLPVDLAEHVICAVADESKLIIYTHSAAWAAQLRFHQRTFLASLSENGESKTKLFRVRICSNIPSIQKQAIEQARVPPTEKIRMIREQCDHLQDIELRESLQRLCSTMLKQKTKFR